ncbi:NADP-dependent oxidoreductase [Streptomyces sp. NPDC013172]|uniref:NADP-dependent oxidoreductase n=1 Tax=Streptomyces sp. NPDC013172 TaxID=3155009 RepID=UPI0033D247A6
MRAIVQYGYGGPKVLALARPPVPEPGPHEVLVRVHAAGLNPVDWQTRSGRGVAHSMGTFPFTVGWDISGEVVRTGSAVTEFGAGDAVFGMPRFPAQAAAYAEYVVAPARDLAPKPVGLDHAQAASLPLAGLTAWTALTAKARVRAGDRVLVHAAAGGVGHLAVQLAKALGAHVIGTASAGKHGFVTALGADEVVDYRNIPFEKAVATVDAVLELSGGDNAARSLSVLRPGGTLVDIAHHGGRGLGAGTGIRVVGMLVKPDGRALRELARLTDQGRLKPFVERIHPLEEAAAAHAYGETRTGTGKLVLATI